MFDMSNWKSAPYTVGTHWATKSVMHYRDPARGSWYTDEVRSDSEWRRDVEHLARTSPTGLVAALVSLRETPESIRSITSVTRGREEVRCGDWVVVRQLGETTMAGRVEQMLLCTVPGSAFARVRMWLRNCKVTQEDEATGVLYAASADTSNASVVRFESAHVEVVVRSVCPSRDEFV